MKKILLPVLAMAALAVGFSACEKDGPKPFKVDPNKMISLYAKSASSFRSGAAVGDSVGDTIFTDYLYTPRQIVDSTCCILPGNRMFAPSQKDTINNRLLMLGTDILFENLVPGTIDQQYIALATYWLQSRNLVLVTDIWREKIDTIAYIPNSVMIKADSVIRALYKEQRYEEIYKEFDKSFYFIPITGARYQYLMERGEN